LNIASRQLLSRSVAQSKLSEIADMVEQEVAAAFETVAAAADATWPDTFEVTAR
jgi:hypothetical protein